MGSKFQLFALFFLLLFFEGRARKYCKPNKSVAAYDSTERLKMLRKEMQTSRYGAYIIPTTDEHQSEFVADCDKRVKFISGYTGTNGMAVVLPHKAALWTDQGYIAQADVDLDCHWKVFAGFPSVVEWINDNLNRGETVGVDTKFIDSIAWDILKHDLRLYNNTLVADSLNLVDVMWKKLGKDLEEAREITVHDIQYAGETWESKVVTLNRILISLGLDGMIVTDLDEIAWLFNLRGRDIPYNPLFKSFAFVCETGIRLFVDRNKLNDEVERHLTRYCPKGPCVQIEDYTSVSKYLKAVKGNILIPFTASKFIVSLISKDRRRMLLSPITCLKMVKNQAEIEGMRKANIRDSAAIAEFVSNLEKQVNSHIFWSEKSAAQKLEKIRKEKEMNAGSSYETISAFGVNSGTVHYHPAHNDAFINGSAIYLLETGGQYIDGGTTDLTRTFHFGKPTQKEKKIYTRVLMGFIDLITFVFSEVTYDRDLAVIPRSHLNVLGKDYFHSTSQSIGSYSIVHERPINIGYPGNNQPGNRLKPNMILSNGPGCFELGKYGIKLQTPMKVVIAQTMYPYSHINYLTFKPITYFPFEPHLIENSFLRPEHINWLNAYNAQVRNTLGKELKRLGKTMALNWVVKRTKKL